MNFNPDAVLADAMFSAKHRLPIRAKRELDHYRQMVRLGAPRAERPRYLKSVYNSDTEMIEKIEKLIEKYSEKNA
jgi:hypothetical protein